MCSAVKSPPVMQTVERIIFFGLFGSFWWWIQWPILNALFFRDMYALVLFPLSLSIVLVLRYSRGGLSEVKRELQSIGRDISFPFWFLRDTLDGTATPDDADWTLDCLRHFATLSKYLVMYGPVSFGGLIILVSPWLFLLQPMLQQDWFAPLQWGAIVLGVMLFCGVAVNTSCHRYFSHASFKANRVVSFFLSAFGCLGGQFGPLWWASNHRRHHKYCETDLDVHSPSVHGFWYSHTGWFMDVDNFPIRKEYLPRMGRDWPELLVLEVFSTNLQMFFFYGLAKFLHAMNIVPSEANTPGFFFQLVVLGPDPGYELHVDDLTSQYVDTAIILGYALFLHWEFFINSLVCFMLHVCVSIPCSHFLSILSISVILGKETKRTILELARGLISIG